MLSGCVFELLCLSMYFGTRVQSSWEFLARLGGVVPLWGLCPSQPLNPIVTLCMMLYVMCARIIQSNQSSATVRDGLKSYGS